ncbi:hypothetical protein ACMZ62_07840 [Streptococcus pluranimalium]|uniref:hypothetical protein n=1 Tax=Streptococcus hyovaginalis TaxID=149015 RepID=UPI00040C0BA8|nr:hypothetical protein [Streptococcus hyovaginalis]MDY3024243.1 hypothetical protein [Streptococcus hyovaginalis]MDY4511056.1 hypothetical protein [Streptococcus hyovaginalis]MDY5974889.1 hypothetical protein [Streptococcus hyovaginalis]
MAKKNPLLEEDINKRIDQVRYEEPDNEDRSVSLFYKIIVTLVTLAVLFSLIRYLF